MPSLEPDHFPQPRDGLHLRSSKNPIMRIAAAIAGQSWMRSSGPGLICEWSAAVPWFWRSSRPHSRNRTRPVSSSWVAPTSFMRLWAGRFRPSGDSRIWRMLQRTLASTSTPCASIVSGVNTAME